MRLAFPLALLALATLPGCILSPGEDDLSYVCEKKSGSPGAAYTLDGLVAFTEVRDPNLTQEKARAVLAAIQPRVITLGGHAHANFTATLDAASDGWRFAGAGRAADGAVLDTYVVEVIELAEGFAVHDTRPTAEEVLPPESLVSRAWEVVNGTPSLAEVKVRTPTLVASGWNKNIPSCVRLLFQDGPSDAILPASPEHPHTVVVVSLVSDRVVFLQRLGWPPTPAQPPAP